MQIADAATPGAHIGDVQRLQHPLHGAVLAEGSVQRGEHYVSVEQSLARAEAEPLLAMTPRALALDLHPANLVPGTLEALAHGARRGQRDIVLGGAPARK